MKSKFYSWFKKYVGPVAKWVFRVHIHGSENEPTEEQGPYVVIANHIANVDPIFICLALDNQQPHYMAKKELFKVPILNKLVAALGAYPVDRNGADVGTIRKTIKMLENGTCIGIFPQGHRQKEQDPRSTEVRNGAAMVAIKAKAQVLPCFIKTKKRKWTPFCRVDVHVGKPISYEEMEYDSEAAGEYSRVSRYLFDKVCDIGDSVNG